MSNFSTATEATEMNMKEHNPGDPYTPNLAHFFTKVAVKDPMQLTLLREYSKVPTLRPYIKKQTDNGKDDGTIMRFDVIDQNKYDTEKQKLGILAFI